jgi:hypothetical protein
VAEASGPFAVDLVKSGTPEAGAPSTGRGSTEDKSVRLTRLTGQNKNGDKAFDPAIRYAFGYEAVAASMFTRRIPTTPR